MKKKRINPSMHRKKVARKNIFMAASLEREADSRELLKAGRYQGAMYLAGYTFECYLKFRICVRFDALDLHQAASKITQQTGERPQFLASKAHSFDLLLRHAGLLEDLRKDKEIGRLFSIVNEWSPDWRYQARKSTADEAERFCTAVQKMLIWMKERSILNRKWL